MPPSAYFSSSLLSLNLSKSDQLLTTHRLPSTDNWDSVYRHPETEGAWAKQSRACHLPRMPPSDYGAISLTHTLSLWDWCRTGFWLTGIQATPSLTHTLSLWGCHALCVGFAICPACLRQVAGIPRPYERYHSPRTPLVSRMPSAPQGSVRLWRHLTHTHNLSVGFGV